MVSVLQTLLLKCKAASHLFQSPSTEGDLESPAAAAAAAGILSPLPITELETLLRNKFALAQCAERDSKTRKFCPSFLTNCHVLSRVVFIYTRKVHLFPFL